MLAVPVSNMPAGEDLNNLPSDDSSDDSCAPTTQVTKKRLQRFSDSDTEKENVSDNKNQVRGNLSDSSSSGIERSTIPSKSLAKKSRIRVGGSSSDSDVTEGIRSVKNEEQQMRMKNKRNKLKDKFKGLLNSRDKQLKDGDKQPSEDSPDEVADDSGSEMSSIAKIKQKIKKTMASMSSICDPDTSDEEDSMSKKQKPKKTKKQQKATKLIEAKPQRMSAKQAMENMQLIKSESNRMLREKAVSLPYHRPKALSLKDIMARRKPALTADGKALPIKMNGDQLKQYAQLLEERQKEMMELCKSESDEETAENDEKCEEAKAETESNIETDKEKSNNINECPENETIKDNIETTSNEANIVNEVTNGSPNDELKDLPETELTKNVDESDNTAENATLNPEKETEEEEKDDSCSDLKLVYNDSIEEEATKEQTGASTMKEQEQVAPERSEETTTNLDNNAKVNSEPESQLISLHFTENNTEENGVQKPVSAIDESSKKMDTEDADIQDMFSDDDINMEDIDKIIENAEIMKDDNTSLNSRSLNAKPTIMGAPGMVIDLDGGDIMPKRLSGVELLKERFTYFSKLKTPEELERDKEKKLKPGAQHLKLKQELEEQIAEQRSLEWAKRLEEEKQQYKEMESILDDAEDSFEKAEKDIEKDEENMENDAESSSSESEEELEENDVELKDKPKKQNPMLDDEAEESDCGDEVEANEGVNDEADDEIDEDNGDDDDDDSSDESSESEEEAAKPKKGRILKAFEDSDDEEVKDETKNADVQIDSNEDTAAVSNEIPSASQDDVLQLAQRHISASDDLFTSQDSSLNDKNKERSSAGDDVLGTQTFSILDSTGAPNVDDEMDSPSKFNVLCMSQPYQDPNLKDIVEGSQLPITQSSQSQPLGEDILALCTGKFYENEFVSPTHESQINNTISQESAIDNFIESQEETATLTTLVNEKENSQSKIDNLNSLEVKTAENDNKKVKEDGILLKSILDELHDPEFDKPKQNKFFTGGTQNKSEELPQSSQMKKRFIIDSDDENTNDNTDNQGKKKKKLKKKKAEQRALQISDDEEEEFDQEGDDEFMSEAEDSNEREVEYDSEENEIEVQPDKPKKKRKVDDFFEQEAELTSEDEWVGSGDEDEKDLDKMEREAGDDEVFHQGKLRRELGQIHMRDVLDQDKREVRIIQELLFEDGDLGDGHRQRKFRWRNAGDEDGTGTVVDEFGDTQEEEYESEEQWRKQRHEREVFLKQMQEKDEAESSLNVSVNRTSIIKANLLSKSMSMLLEEVNQTNIEKTESPVLQEKKTTKDIPSPKKAFTIFQQNYHGSLLTRGRGALARLAALATPLAADDDAPKTSSLAPHKGNFVFAALTPKEKEPKVTIKRKADANQGTPKLVKKMKIEEKQIRLRSSLLDHVNL